MKRRVVFPAAALILATTFLCAQNKPTQDKPVPDKPDLPTAASIIQHYIDATGGKAAYDAQKTETSSGTFSIAATGINGTIKEYSAAPAKAYAEMDIPGVGKMQEGTDGNIAWENSALMGARLLTGDEASAAMRKAAADALTNWKKYYKTAEVKGVETVEGKTCYKLEMKPFTGPLETDYYDKQSGFLVKNSATYDTPMGPVPAETILSDYRKQGDLMVPFHIEQKMAGQQFDIKLDKVELNADIPDSRFVPPAEVRALQK